MTRRIREECKFIHIFLVCTKNSTIFQSGEFVQPSTRSLDSPYTEHGTLPFHPEHRLNRLPHEYMNISLPLATVSVHANKLPPSHDMFQK
jgi:hypothetical protein